METQQLYIKREGGGTTKTRKDYHVGSYERTHPCSWCSGRGFISLMGNKCTCPECGGKAGKRITVSGYTVHSKT